MDITETPNYKERPEDSGFIARFYYQDDPSEKEETGIIIKASDALFDRISPFTDFHFRGGLMGVAGVLYQITMIKIDNYVTISIPYNAYEQPENIEKFEDIVRAFDPFIFALELASQETIEITFYNPKGQSKTLVKANPIKRVFRELINIITRFSPWDQSEWENATKELKRMYGADLAGLWDRCDLSKPENHRSEPMVTKKPKNQVYKPPSPVSFSNN